MRRIILSISFMALLAALWGLWQCRFERTQGLPVWRLNDLRESAPPVPGIEWLGTEDHPMVRVTVAVGTYLSHRLVERANRTLENAR